MMRILVLAVFSLSMLQSPAGAQENVGHSGPYLILGVAAGKTNDPRAQPAYEADLGLDIGAQVGIGYAYRALRLEAQLGYEAFFLNDLETGSGATLSDVDAYGRISGPVAMANLFFRPGDAGRFHPFLGAGIGVASLHTEIKGDYCSVPLATCYTNARIVSGQETVQAWQWAIGMSKLARDGSSELAIGYRYFSTEDFDTELVDFGPVTQDGLESHSLMLNWRWYFGALGR